jgi:hypothetical protein
MGYDAYSQLFVGTEICNIVEKVVESKTIEVKDEWTNKVKGTKQVSRSYYKFNGEEFIDLYDVERKLDDLGLSTFMVSYEDGFEGMFIGIGRKTSYNKKVLKTNLDDLQKNIENCKKIFETLGYVGEVEVYSTLYESY